MQTHAFFSNTRLQSLLLFGLAFALYANTLRHGFVLDDLVVITQNKWTQQGIGGIAKIFSDDSFSGYLGGKQAGHLLAGGRYRPLSLACFAALGQWFGAGNALAFHLFAVLLYALNGVLVYRLVLRFRTADTGRAQWVAWATALLFVAHPVHTEVVANVKSCDEQLALFFGLAALYCLFLAVDRPGKRWPAGAFLCFLLACLAKENAVTLIVAAPLALWFFRPVSPGVALRRTWPLALVLAVFLALRGWALGWQFGGQMMHDPLNNPFLKSNGQQWVPFSAQEQAATVLYILLKYLGLLVWPYPLTHDYYPFQIGAQTFSKAGPWAGLLGYGLLLAWAIRAAARKSPAAFGVLFYLITLSVTVNIFFPVGVFMAERFLFLPSLGFCLALAASAAGLAVQRQNWMTAGWVALVALFGLLTLRRNPDWASNDRLLRTDITASPNSAKLRNDLGTLLLDEALQTPDPARRRALLEEAETHLKRAIELHPTYYDACLAYGACAFYVQKFDASIDAYRRANRLDPQDAKNRIGLAYALRYGGDFYARERKDPETAIRYLSEAWQLQPDTAIALHLSANYQQTGRPEEAAGWVKNAAALAPNDPAMLRALSKAWLAAGHPAEAADAARRAAALQPPAPH